MRAHGDPDVAGVLHCFAEDWETAEGGDGARLLRLHFRHRHVPQRRRAARAWSGACRRTALLVETDAPWLSPAPHRGKPNEPMRVRRVAECVAEVRGERLEALAEQTTENFFRLFSRAAASAPQSSSNSTS